MRASVLLFAALFFASCGGEAKKDAPGELIMFCAAGLKAPVDRIAKAYQAETGVNVRLQFGGSGTLLSSLQIAPGDIFLAADASYTELAKAKGLIGEAFPVAWMKAGFGVPHGNPKKLTKLADLKREGIRLGIGNPEAGSIGRLTKEILSKHGAWADLKPTAVFPTVNELANAIKLGTVDVVIIWDAVAAQYPEINFISLPEFASKKVSVTVAPTTSSKNPAEALKFCRYLTASDKGDVIFREEGYEVSTED